MADDTDDSEKTEDPTPRRLQDAAEQGDIVKSQEVSTFVLLGAGTLAIALFGHSSAEAFARGFRALLERPDQFSLGAGGAMDLARHVLWSLIVILGPPLGLLMGAGLAANRRRRAQGNASRPHPRACAGSVPGMSSARSRRVWPGRRRTGRD